MLFAIRRRSQVSLSLARVESSQTKQSFAANVVKKHIQAGWGIKLTADALSFSRRATLRAVLL
jgi:hypothetical protein